MSLTDNGLTPEDRSALEGLVLDWSWLLDHGRPHDAADLLTDDGVFLGFPEPIVGRDGFRAWADRRAAKTDRQTHHQITNLRLRHVADGRADGSVGLVLRVVDADSSVPREDFVGEYVDEFRRTSEGWRFQKRTLVALGSS